jgi:tRNA-splicing ligase RtcB
MSKTRREDPLELRCRALAVAAGLEPDARVAMPGGSRTMPAWCTFRDAARAERHREDNAAVELPPQAERYKDSPLTVIGTHDEATVAQMRTCMGVGNAVAGVICADGHLGYAQPVGGVIAYEKQISISGVGFDIGCGNMAVRLDTPYAAIADRVGPILADVRKVISFGVGRSNAERVEHDLFDDGDAWRESDMGAYRQKAVSQLGTVGSGNHYVDLMRDEAGLVWIGVHFGSRGLGHTSATRYLKAAGGKDGMHVAPAVVDEESELGRRYIAAMQLAGRYSYAGREWVVERVRQIIGGAVTDMVHNHHNYAWRENHVVGGEARDLWVVRKGATPAFPGQRGFVGGSMGDDAVILEGVDGPQAKAALYSTVHGAGRLFGRKQALRTFERTEMDAWLQARGVMLAGGDLDESPMAYRRLPDVLAHHDASVRVLHRLRPFAVAMAGSGEFDPWKD